MKYLSIIGFYVVALWATLVVPSLAGIRNAKTTTPSTTTTLRRPPCPCDCTELVLIPDKNCGKYWQCDNEVATEISCPKGLEFNPDTKICDWPENANCTGEGWCNKDLICPIPTKSTKPPRSPSTTRNPNAPPCPNNCLELVLVPDKNCGKYWQCDNEKATELSCPKGLEFNPDKKICDWPEDANCTGKGWCSEDLICPVPTKSTTPPTSPSTTRNPNAPPCPSNCLELVLIPDKNCGKYWQCESEEATELSCPKGLEFNPNKKVCDWPEDANCTGEGWRSDDLICPVPTKSTKPPTSPSTTRNPKAPPCPSNCLEFVLIPDKNCGKYWQCDNDEATELSCPKGLEFNPNKKICDWPEEAYCTGEGWYSDDLICPVPTKSTKPPSPSTTRNPNAPPCPDNCLELVLIPDKNCGKYWQCDNDEATELSCPKGLEFNPNKKVCDWPEDANCSGEGWCSDDLICPVPTKSTKPPTSPSTTRNPNAPPCPNNCLELVLIPDKDCGKYWQCDNDEATELSCPKGLEFNPDKKVCDWPEEANCTGEGWCSDDLICPVPTKSSKPPTSPSTTRNPNAPPCPGNCLELVLIPDKNCGKYWQCDNEEATELSCPKGLEFNPNKKICDWPEEANCTGEGWYSDDLICPVPSKSTKPPTSPSTTRNPNAPPCPDNCLELVLIPDKNCGKYWQCDNDEATELSCPKGLEFNPNKKVCDWPEDANCSGEGWCSDDLICPVPTKSTKPPTSPSTTRNPNAPPCPNNCLELVLIPDKDCGKYWQCDNDEATELSCPNGLEFNPDKKVCDWPEEANCTGEGWCSDDLICPVPTKSSKPPTSPSTTRNPNAPPCPGNCLELVLIPDKNCGKYWQCDNDEATELSCPKGLEFNPNKKVCDWPEDANCTGEGWCSDDLICPVPTKSTKPPTSPSTTRNPNAPPCPDNCLELVLIPDKNCGKYWQCDNDEATQLSCPKGLEFNPNKKVCDWPEDANCSGEGWCSDDLICPVPTKSTKPPTSPSTTRNPNAPPCPNNCLELVLIPDKDCGKYWQCDNDEATELSCPKGLEFNPDKKVCDWPEEANCTGEGWCSGDLICPVPTKSSKPPTSPSTTRNPNAPPCPGNCLELVLIPDKNCGKYWQCDNDEATELSCPKGLEFNPNKKVCDWPEDANCTGEGWCSDDLICPVSTKSSKPSISPSTTRNPKAPPCPSNCLELVLIPDKDCGKYWQCDNDEATELSCPKGLEFNPDKNVCDWPEEANCTGEGWCSDDLICPIPTTPTSPPIQTPITKNPRAPPCPNNCTELVLIPDKDCCKYWQCDNEVATELSCPRGLEFNPDKKVCDWPDEANCMGQGWCNEDLECPPATKLTSPSPTTRNPNAPPCAANCSELILIPSKDCCKYWQCDNGIASEQSCPSGLQWNPRLSVCDWPVDAECTGEGWCDDDLKCPSTTKPTTPTPRSRIQKHENH